MKKEQMVDIVVDKNGDVEVDLIGFRGKGCEHAVDDILNAIGKKVDSKKKNDYYKSERVKNKNVM
ncbi:MAG: DUF2997 domain-containing protein [Elusimicrobiota bacterium]